MAQTFTALGSSVQGYTKGGTEGDSLTLYKARHIELHDTKFTYNIRLLLGAKHK